MLTNLYKTIRCVLVLSMALSVTPRTVLAEPAIGEKVPDFTLTSLDGKELTLSDYSDQTVILEWTNPDCPNVNRLYDDETFKLLRDQSVPFGMNWFIINSTHYMTPAKTKWWAEKREIDVPFLMDTDGKVGKLFDVRQTPEVLIINKGILVYRGAVDDDPHGDYPPVKRQSYVKNALRDIYEKRPVRKEEAKPYGCSVKYKK